jgi:hypothetical protein
LADPRLPIRSLRRLPAVLVLSVLAALVPAGSSARAHGLCARIGVESREGRTLLSSYEVAESDYVAKMHRLIDQSGDGTSWTVSAGELGSAGYTVTYACLPAAFAELRST